jgi:hypothetical protein
MNKRPLVVVTDTDISETAMLIRDAAEIGTASIVSV